MPYIQRNDAWESGNRTLSEGGDWNSMAIQSILQWKIADPIEGINYEYTFSPAPRSKSIEFVPPLCANKIGMYR